MQQEPENMDLPLHDDTLLTQRTWSYYAALSIVIPVQAIPLLSWLAIILEAWRNGLLLVRSNTHLLEKLAVLWALLEVSLALVVIHLCLLNMIPHQALFSLHHWFLVDKLARRPAKIDQTELSYLRLIFNRILHVGLYDKPRPVMPPREYNGDTELNVDDIPALSFDDPRAVDFRNSLRTWFSRSSWSAISRTHMLSWLSWSMFNASFDSMTEEQRALIVKALVMMERRTGARFPDKASNRGSGGDAKTLRLTLDPMSVSSRPLIAYFLINVAGIATMNWLEWKYGARYETTGGTT
jgi:hypothetical protein